MYLRELNGEAEATRRVLARIPEDRLEWRPHEKSLSFGRLGLHVATLPAAMAELATHDSFDVRTEIPRPSPRSVSEVMEVLEGSLEKVKAIMGAMDDAALASSWRMVSGDKEIMSIPRAALLRSVLLNTGFITGAS